MTILQDAPGGAAFIASIVDAAKSFALLYAGTSDDQSIPHLESFIASIEPIIVDAVGAGPAAKILEAMRATIMTHKHELERGGPASGALH
jgi:hypothetical protein